MSSGSDIPSSEHLEALLRGLKRVQMEWNQHIVFVEAELSSQISNSAADSQASLADAIAGLAQRARFFDFRVQQLANMDYPDLEDEESRSSVDKLLSFVTKPMASETASNLLRRAAARLESEIECDSEAVEDMENLTSDSIQDVTDMVNELRRMELDEPTSSLVSSLQKLQDWRARFAAQPEDAVWMEAFGYAIEFLDKYVTRSKTEAWLRYRQIKWLKVLEWSARFDVQVGERQALITEFFDRV